MRDGLFDQFTREVGAAVTRRAALRAVGAAMLVLFTHPRMGGFWQQSGGCSVEYPPVDVLGDCPSRRHHPENSLTYANGCGPEGGPSFPNEYSPSASFLDACNQHDCCYGRCNSDKATCDTNFGNQLYQACRSGYPGLLHTLSFELCMHVAYRYALAVEIVGGAAYNTAQTKDCECCREPCPHCYSRIDGKCVLPSGSGPCGRTCCSTGKCQTLPSGEHCCLRPNGNGREVCCLDDEC